MKDRELPEGFADIIELLNIEWPARYGGDVHVGYGYGFIDLNEIESGAEPRWIIYAYSDDEAIRNQLPKQIDGYDVQVSGVPVAQ
jgi:hypothetical protein